MGRRTPAQRREDYIDEVAWMVLRLVRHLAKGATSTEPAEVSLPLSDQRLVGKR